MKVIYNQETIELNDEVQINMAKHVISRNLPIQYVKRKAGYDVYCPNCQDYTKYPEDKFKEIKYSKCCPKCRCESIVKEYKKPLTIFGFSFYETYKGSNGYEVDVTFRFKKEFSVKTKHVYKEENGKKYVKELWLGMGYTSAKPCWVYGDVWPRNKKWHQITSERWLYDFMICDDAYIPKTKKQILSEYERLNLKSNQVKLILDHPFNSRQIRGIKMFDLKNSADVYKNRAYLERQFKYSGGYIKDSDKYRFNVSTLVYLRKNDIGLSLYKDYVDMCKKLDRKPDKPKDFQLWHDRLTVMVHVAETKDLAKNIKKRYEELKENNYHRKNIDIKAFSTKKEIQHVSKCLHNCMSRLYMKDYASGETDLYHLDVDGIPVLAIEINEGKLTQCYGDKNSTPPKNLKNIVERWSNNICFLPV